MATRNSASESLQFLAATKTITASHIVTKMEQATRLAMYLTSQIHFFYGSPSIGAAGGVVDCFGSKR